MAYKTHNTGVPSRLCYGMQRIRVRDVPVSHPMPVPAPAVASGFTNALMNDAQVLECRGLHEFHGWDRKRLAEKYGMTVDYMKKLLDYSTRSKLIPKRQK